MGSFESECIFWDRGILLPNITMIKITHVPIWHQQFFCLCHLQQMCLLWIQLQSHTASGPWLTCVFLSDALPRLAFVLTLMGLDSGGQCLGRIPTLDPNLFENGPCVPFILTWPLNMELWIWGGYISSVILMSLVTLQDLLTGHWKKPPFFSLPQSFWESKPWEKWVPPPWLPL